MKYALIYRSGNNWYLQGFTNEPKQESTVYGEVYTVELRDWNKPLNILLDKDCPLLKETH